MDFTGFSKHKYFQPDFEPVDFEEKRNHSVFMR